MAADTKQQQPSPALGITSRVLGVPLVSQGLDTIHTTLSNSPYTKAAYQTTQAIAISAYGTAARVSGPVYPTLQPVISVADGYASKGFDTLHSHFPYPFEATPQVIYADMKKAPEDAKNVAYKTIDERIKTPAYGLAKGVDHSLTPLVDLLEAILLKLHAKPETPVDTAKESTSEAVSEKPQVARAKDLVFGAKDHVIALTSEQAKALRDQNVYIKQAADHVDALNSTIATHYQNAQAGISVYREKGAETFESYKGGITSQIQNAQASIASYKGKGVEFGKETQAKVYALSQSTLAELEKIQATTAALPAQIQTTFKPLTDAIGSTVMDMKAILLTEEEGVGVSEKAARLGTLVKERVGPIVEQGKVVYAAALDKFVAKKNEVTTDEAPKVNGVKDT